MKTTIHIYKVWAAGLAFAALMMTVPTACTETQYAPQQTEEEENHPVPVTLMAMQPGGGGEDGKPDTRLAYDNGLNEDGTGSVKVSWEDGDQLRVFTFNKDGGFKQADKDGEVLTTNGAADANGMVTFTGTITPGDDGKIYCAYGSIIKDRNWNKFDNTFSVANSSFTQNCNDLMKHLTKSDILYAVGEEGQPLSFKRRMAMLRFLVTLPEAKSIKTLVINASGTNRPFISRAKLGLTSRGWDRDFDPGNKITLKLENHAASTEVTGYVLIASRPDVKDDNLTLTLTATDDTQYQSKINFDYLIKGWEPGKCYTIKATVEKVNP